MLQAQSQLHDGILDGTAPRPPANTDFQDIPMNNLTFMSQANPTALPLVGSPKVIG